MDKFDSLVRKKEVLHQRCYGDNPELLALLKRAGATFLKLDVTNNREHCLLPSGTRIASLEAVADILMTEPVDGILLHWYEVQYQHYCTVRRVESVKVWTARPAVQEALRVLVQKSSLVHALTLSPGRARAACVSLLGTFRNDAPMIVFGKCLAVFQGKAKQFKVPRGDNRFTHHDSVTNKLEAIFPLLVREEVSQKVTVLQWFFGTEYQWFTAARFNDSEVRRSVQER